MEIHINALNAKLAQLNLSAVESEFWLHEELCELELEFHNFFKGRKSDNLMGKLLDEFSQTFAMYSLLQLVRQRPFVFDFSNFVMPKDKTELVTFFTKFKSNINRNDHHGDQEIKYYFASIGKFIMSIASLDEAVFQRVVLEYAYDRFSKYTKSCSGNVHISIPNSIDCLICHNSKETVIDDAVWLDL